MKVAAVELPAQLSPDIPAWDRLRSRLAAENIDLLVVNELPFGEWLPESAVFADEAARKLDQVYQDSLTHFADLPVGAVITTRGRLGQERLLNEAVLISEGPVIPLHRKQIFPQEPGFFEQSWFEASKPQFETSVFQGLTVGVLICTELMFTELARGYGRAGAHLIAVPRASENAENWLLAARMAALTSGCYIVSSNRRGFGQQGVHFGGCGFIVSPDGEVLAMTTEDKPLVAIDIDVERVRLRQSAYPCYIDPDFLRQPGEGIGT